MLTFTLGTFAIALNHLLLISALALATFVGWRVAKRGGDNPPPPWAPSPPSPVGAGGVPGRVTRPGLVIQCRGCCRVRPWRCCIRRARA